MLGRHRVNRNKHDIQDSGHTLDQPQGQNRREIINKEINLHEQA